MLIWKKELWLIDHGASFYFHHTWENWERTAASNFMYVKDHVLLPQAAQMDEANQYAHSRLNEEKLHRLVDEIPESWLIWQDLDATPDEIRNVYKQFLSIRLKNSVNFVTEAKNARNVLI
ncbi:hypothetical protein D3C86_1826630 [compost metagenome]